MNISYHDARYILDLDALSVTQKLLLFALLTHMHPGTKRIYPSYATLSTELGCDRRTVMRNINFLTKEGVLEVRKEPHAGRRCNVYVVPFSDGYAYKSEQNDPSVPKPVKKPKDDAPSDTKREPDENEWHKAKCAIVYKTSIPSVFVDIMFEEIRQMDFIDALGKRITPRTLQSHIARMWKHCQERPFYARLEKVWDEHWENIHQGVYADEEESSACLDALQEEYGVYWDNTDPDEEMHAPILGFNPRYQFYPDKSEWRKKNNVTNPPLDI